MLCTIKKHIFHLKNIYCIGVYNYICKFEKKKADIVDGSAAILGAYRFRIKSNYYNVHQLYAKISHY